MHTTKLRFLYLIMAIVSFTGFQSCGYTIRVTTKTGTGMPDYGNNELGDYHFLKVYRLDTIAKLKVLDNSTTIVLPEDEDGLYSIEYRVSFGAILRNTLCIGKRRTVKIKYVYLHQIN